MTSFLWEVIDHPGFLRSDISTQQQIQHLSFICNLVFETNGLNTLETVIEEHKLIKARYTILKENSHQGESIFQADIDLGFLAWDNAVILKQRQQKMLQNLKMLGKSISQTTFLEKFETGQDQDYGDTENSEQHLEPKDDQEMEKAVLIQFTKKKKSYYYYQKKKEGRKTTRIVTASGRVRYREKKKNHVCDSCDGFETSTMDKLLRHQFEDHGQTLCSDCGASFVHYGDLRTHRFSHNAPIKCDFCDEVFVNPRLRKVHMTTQHRKTFTTSNIQVMCPDCGDIFSGKSSLEKHILRKHNTNKMDLGDKLQCPHCEFSTLERASMNRHIKRVHDTTLKPKPCPFCNRMVKNLQEHLQRTQCDIPENERTLKKYRCDTCSKNFSSKGSYDRHMKNVHSEGSKIHKCDLCNYATYTKFNLFIHVRRMHEGKKLKRNCPYCLKDVVKLEFHVGLFHPEFAHITTMTDD